MNKLTVTLPSDLEILMVRDFDAPKELVFEAFTKCEHLKRWWGMRDSQLVACEMDFRVGGKWRRVSRAADGSDHPFKGEFLEIEAPTRLSETFIYDVEYARDYPAVETMTLTERDGKTTLTALVVHRTKEGRDGHYSAGMEVGAAETYDRLEELLDQLMQEAK
jgi:uncharacterized protein YndB with AHSA1/START domain